MKSKTNDVAFGGHDWKIESPDEKGVVYYIDMCPCDNMQDYMKSDFYPQFVKEDTPIFDTEEAATVQVATHHGWAIVAKWGNNGSTRIYGMKPEVVMDACLILGGPCDCGDCTPAYGEYKVTWKYINDKQDSRVFYGRDPWSEMYEEEVK